MARAKQVSKRKGPKIALPVWGAAGMSLAMAGGASAGVAPTADTASKHNALPSVVTLGEEELSDPEQDCASDVDGYTDRRQDVRRNTGRSKSTDHRIDDPHCASAYACS